MVPRLKFHALGLFLGMLCIVDATEHPLKELKEECPCKIDAVKKTSTCDSIRIKTLPDCIPSTTEILELFDNDLRYRKGQFQRFANLTYLDLSCNYDFNPFNDSFVGLVNLRVLFLNHTLYTNPESGVFAGLINLQILALDGNVDGEDLRGNIFAGLSNLTHLAMVNNPTIKVQEDQFSDLRKLQYLDLSYNYKLSNINKQTFSNLRLLKYLSLKGTGWFYLDVGQDVFQPLIMLEELHLEDLCSDHRSPYPEECSKIDHYLQHVPSLRKLFIHNVVLESSLGQGFGFLVRLEEIHFSNIAWRLPRECRIADFWSDTLRNLAYTSLLKLSIRQCRVGSIDGRVFFKFRYLQSLDLELSRDLCDNFMEDITIGLEYTMIQRLKLSARCLFRGYPEPILESLMQTQLDYLDLSYGAVKMVDNLLISNLPTTIKYLYLNNNQIWTIVISCFNHLEHLLVLDLSNQQEDVSLVYNEENIFSQTFHASKHHFRSLELNSNGVMESTNKSSSKKEKLTNTHVGLPRIKSVDNDCFPFPSTLISLNVSNTELLCDIIKGLCGTKLSLQILNVSYQKDLDCMDLFWNVLKNLNTLEILDLSGNGFRNLTGNLFSGLTKLRTLNLADNLLMEISFDVFSMTSLKTLDITGNTIQFASKEFTMQVQRLAKETDITIYLRENRLICDCKRRYFISWLKDTTVVFQKDNLKCNFENGTEMSLAKVSKILYLLETQCIILEVTLSCVGGFVVLNLLGFLMSQLWHNRWKLKYLMSFAKRTINPYHPLEESQIEMEYDVYISYDRDFDLTNNETLHGFVAQKLHPALKQKGFRVLIREELDVGMRLYEVISKALRKSEKVLVLLSNDYCKDYWNVFEFNTAAMEGIYTKRQVIIPVAFENISLSGLHEEVRAFLSSGSVPAYTNKISEQAFIEYLCERIRDNRPFD